MKRNYFRFYKDFYEIVKDLPPEEQLAVYTAIMKFVFYGNDMTAEKPKQNPNKTQTKPNDNPNSNKAQKTQENPNITQLKPSSILAFNLIKRQLSIDNKQFINGCKGGRPRKARVNEKKPTETQTKPNDNPNSVTGNNISDIISISSSRDNIYSSNNKDNIIPPNISKDILPPTEKKTLADNGQIVPSPPVPPPPSPKPKRSVFVKPTIEEVKAYFVEKGFKADPEHYYDYFESNGWRTSGGRGAMKDWKAAARNWERNDSKFKKRDYAGNTKPVYGNKAPEEFGKGYWSDDI